MLKNILEFLESVTATVISGVFLLLALIPHAAEHFGMGIAFFDALPISPAWISVIISGTPLVFSAVRKLCKNRGIAKISSALLISIAMIASVAIGDIFAAGEVAFIMAIGEILEEKTTARAKRGLKNLISLSPTTGRIVTDNGEEIVPADKIKKGDTIRILPGETIPVDGRIISGFTSVDQSVMTGESLPVDKEAGDSVFSGTLNCYGSIDVLVTKAGEDSSLQRLIRMVRNAENQKAPIQRIADRLASILVPIALALAVIAGVLRGDITVAVTVLVVFCPCALVLATPTAIMAAIGQATKHGIIIKSGEALERVGKVDTIAFDKTGTLTTGAPAISDTISFCTDSETVLALAAAAESKSEHPLGKAIYRSAKNMGIEIPESTEFSMTAGKGVCARVGDCLVLCGNEKYLSDGGVAVPAETKEKLSLLENEGKALALVAKDEVFVGAVALSDSLKPNAEAAVASLKDMGVTPVLLTGDNPRAARFFAEKAGIEKVHASLLPGDKGNIISTLQKEGKTVLMVGDGVNDAPALKIAAVGAAMGAMGSDIAIEAADIALMSDDISRISYLKRLANATTRTIKLSIGISLLINLAAIVLSILSLLTPTTGALVHNAGSCLVVLFSALLYDRKIK